MYAGCYFGFWCAVIKMNIFLHLEATTPTNINLYPFYFPSYRAHNMHSLTEGIFNSLHHDRDTNDTFTLGYYNSAKLNSIYFIINIWHVYFKALGKNVFPIQHFWKHKSSQEKQGCTCCQCGRYFKTNAHVSLMQNQMKFTEKTFHQ